MALRVGAVRLTKMRGAFDLATIGSSAGGNTGGQTLEYKGFDGKKASEMRHPTVLRHGAGDIFLNFWRCDSVFARLNSPGWRARFPAGAPPEPSGRGLAAAVPC